jgi:uncharacterized protein YndB with AHSA1/START domain
VNDLTIEREIVIDAPAAVVWRTITEPDQIVQWFSDRVELDLRVGGDGAFVFEHDDTGGDVTAPLRIEVVDEPHRFAFRWAHPDNETPGPDNSVFVEFTLTELGPEQTRLRVAETGLADLDWSTDDKVRYAEDHRHGWQVHFGRLGTLLGTGTG